MLLDEVGLKVVYKLEKFGLEIGVCDFDKVLAFVPRQAHVTINPVVLGTPVATSTLLIILRYMVFNDLTSSYL